MDGKSNYTLFQLASSSTILHYTLYDKSSRVRNAPLLGRTDRRTNGSIDVAATERALGATAEHSA